MDNLKGLGIKKPFHVRMPSSLRSSLETSAMLANRSLNAHIGLLLDVSITSFPVVEMAPAITETLSKKPFGIRLQDALKAELGRAAKDSGRAINTEIVIRLLLATSTNSATVEINQIPRESKHHSDLITAWKPLSHAIEDLLCADLGDLSKASVKLRKAKAEYERLVQLKQLAINTRASLFNR